MLASSVAAPTRGYRPLAPSGEDQFVYEHDSSDDHSVLAQSRSVIDRYSVRLFDPDANGTSVAAATVGVGGLVLVVDPPAWESWLGEIGAVLTRRWLRSRSAL